MSVQTRTTAIQNEIVRLYCTFEYDGLLAKLKNEGPKVGNRNTGFRWSHSIRPCSIANGEHGCLLRRLVYPC